MLLRSNAHGSHLPPEILSYIFRILSIIHPPFRKMKTSIFDMNRAHTLGWVHVSHVCRFWRNVAIGDRALWTDISSELTGPWITEALLRSRREPINLFLFSNDTSPAPETLTERALGSPELLRLKRLRLEAQMPCNLEHAVKRLGQPFPLLEDLSIRVPPSQTYLPDDLSVCANFFPSTTLPDTISAATLPQLRKLALRGYVPATWDASYLQNLTALELDATAVNGTSLAITTCIALLRRSPCLESVTLSNVLMLPSGRQHLALHHLKRITVKSDILEPITALLTRLDLPSGCKAHAEYRNGGESPLPSLSRHLDPGRRIAKVSIAPWAALKGQAILAAWDDAEAYDMCDAQISVQWWRPTHAWPALLREFCDVVHLGGVVALEMIATEGYAAAQPTDFESVLQRTPSMRRLTLSGANTARIFELLARTEPAEDGDGDGHVALLPLLEELTVVNYTPRYMVTDGAHLLAMLRARRSHGARIRKLVLSTSLLSPDGSRLVDSLREHVDQLHLIHYQPVGLYDMF